MVLLKDNLVIAEMLDKVIEENQCSLEVALASRVLSTGGGASPQKVFLRKKLKDISNKDLL